jgi:hypothetical protein
VVADQFQIQLPGYNGSDPYNLFTTGTVSGTPSVGISGNLILDGSITARIINVGQLSAITANLGTITAGLLQSPDSRFIVDLTNRRITIADGT